MEPRLKFSNSEFKERQTGKIIMQSTCVYAVPA